VTLPSADWQNRGECRRVGADGRRLIDPDQFFTQGRTPKEVVEACGACPVRVECLNAALRDNIRDGVWGGMSERARRTLHQRYNREHSTDGRTHNASNFKAG
jgi:hypothetical protein